MMDDPRNPKDNNNNNNNNNTATDKSQRPDDDTNPFISFRRYADDQIHSLMSSVMSLPATLSKEHDRWHASRQHGDQQATESGREEVWMKQWSSEKRGGDDDNASKRQDDPSRWVKLCKPDGQEVKPEVTEDPNGGKTWHWSTSWSWPPKNKGKQDSESGWDDSDAAQRKALDEAQRNAEKEMQELTNLFKSWFGVDDNKKDGEQSARPQSLLDWIWPGEHASAERRAEMRREVEAGITQVLGLMTLFSGTDHSTASRHRHCMPDEAREGSKILQLLDLYYGSSYSWAFPARFEAPPYLLDYSNPRTRWVLEHPYSPAVLEADAIRKGTAPPRYTDAFEDLMRAESGVGMRASDWERGSWRHSHRLLTTVHSHHPGTQPFWQNVERGGEWYVPEKQDAPASSSAQSRKQLEAPSAPDTTAAKDIEARDHMYERFLGAHTADPKTELDMYERFLGDSSAHHHDQPPSESNPTAARPMPPAVIDVSASPILSTITTTERNVAADGTVTTKVTLKKRFADGREESSETVNTARGDAPPFFDDDAGKKKSGGWFWSN